MYGYVDSTLCLSSIDLLDVLSYIILTSIVDTIYEFIILVRGDNFLSQMSCLHQFIYPCHISAVHVLYKYTW